MWAKAKKYVAKNHDIILRKGIFYKITKDTGGWCGDCCGHEDKPEEHPLKYISLDDDYNVLEEVKNVKQPNTNRVSLR